MIHSRSGLFRTILFRLDLVLLLDCGLRTFGPRHHGQTHPLLIRKPRPNSRHLNQGPPSVF